jgi:hypothetical protein
MKPWIKSPDPKKKKKKRKEKGEEINWYYSQMI